MVLQFQDCVDVMKCLHPDCDCVSLFDHSCGRDRKRPDGLCADSTWKGFGGKQPEMRDAKIESDAHCTNASRKMLWVPHGLAGHSLSSCSSWQARKGSGCCGALDRSPCGLGFFKAWSHGGCWGPGACALVTPVCCVNSMRWFDWQGWVLGRHRTVPLPWSRRRGLRRTCSGRFARSSCSCTVLFVGLAS
jgi:hypothetical protein